MRKQVPAWLALAVVERRPTFPNDKFRVPGCEAAPSPCECFKGTAWEGMAASPRQQDQQSLYAVHSPAHRPSPFPLVFQMKCQTLALLPAVVSALPAGPARGGCKAAMQTIHQFPNGTWIENIAVRASGELLLTRLDEPYLYQVDPRNGSSVTAVHRFDGYTSALGIGETAPDVFAVAVGNISLQTGPGAGTFAVWTVDMRGQEARAVKLADMPEAVFLNGMVSDMNAGSILISDSARGVVFRVDALSGEYTVALDDGALRPPANASFPLGINGIRYADGYLYYANTLVGTFGRVPVDAVTGQAQGPIDVMARVSGDDFALGREGAAFLADGFNNAVVRVGADGALTTIAGGGNSTAVPGPTSAALGRTRRDRNVLYVTTSGGQAQPINGHSEGGKVVAIRVG